MCPFVVTGGSGTLCYGHVVESAESQWGVRAAQQSQGVRGQGRGVRVICRVGVTLQEVLGFGYCHFLFLDE